MSIAISLSSKVLCGFLTAEMTSLHCQCSQPFQTSGVDKEIEIVGEHLVKTFQET